MSLPSRRRVLAGAVPVLSSLLMAGCSAPDADATSPTPTRTPTPESTPEDGIEVHVLNGTGTALTVQLAVRESDDVIVEETLRVSADDIESLWTRIRETGEYELAVDVKGRPRKTWTFEIGDYQLRTGSNLLVTVMDEEITLRIEQ